MARVDFDFSDQVVVVTGGSRGVGAGIVAAFVEAGATVTTCGRHEAVVPGAHFVTADVRQPADARRVIDTAAQRSGRLDVLVNNAGGAPLVRAADASPNFISSVVALNLLAPFSCAQAAYAVMAPQAGGGVIVNVGSVSGLRASPGAAAYGAAKAGLVNLTATLAVEWAPAIRVNCVSAGLLRTEAGDDLYGGPDGAARATATVPLGRLGGPADVALACLFLSSPASAYISGTNLILHGGGEWPAYLTAIGDPLGQPGAG